MEQYPGFRLQEVIASDSDLFKKFQVIDSQWMYALRAVPHGDVVG
jgi:hypothetical protein